MKKQNVLVVDDEQGFRDMLTFLLEPVGFEVDCVVNGQEAVDKVAEREYAVIIMDVHMPILTGPEALKKIKTLRPSQKVIMLSSSSDPAHALESQAEAHGIIACLYKPVELNDLQTALKKALGAFPGSL